MGNKDSFKGNTETINDAMPSNAGDRYHFVYVARRMIDMLHPRNKLEFINMENVAKEDLIFQDNPETFLGVDLTEYYTSDNDEELRDVVVVQVKYSPTHPNSTWTLNKLCKNKLSKNGNEKSGSSVLRKLANAFDAFYKKYDKKTRKKVTIKLYTNQDLSTDLRKYLKDAKELVNGKDDLDGSKILRDTEGEIKVILNELEETTNLSWKRLAAFLSSWDISCFGQNIISDVEADLFSSASQYITDFGQYVNTLIGYIQDHAIPNRSTEIYPEKVYALLRLRKEDFFPAPTKFYDHNNLLFTQSAKDLLDAIENKSKGIILFHGVSGVGKSTALQIAAQKYGDGRSTVIYDCYAGGAGLQSGSERFPYKKFFVQIINELDGLFHTDVIANTRLEYEHIMREFNKSLTVASEKAKKLGNKLIIAIDAIDNALFAANLMSVYTSDSFVPLIWNLKIPENCIFVISCRTENCYKFVSDIKSQYEELEITGFIKSETHLYMKSLLSDPSIELTEHMHSCTKGNPRVQSKIMDSIEHEGITNLYNYIKNKAKENAFKYYNNECPERLKTEEEKLVLSILLEMRPLVNISTLADIVKKSKNEVRNIIEKIYFGLRISDEDTILWQDQDFLEFAKEYLEEFKEKSRSILSDYCKANYNIKNNNYARYNLSFHFYKSGLYKQLIDWWLNEDKLSLHIASSEIYQEDALIDIKYTILASLKLNNYTDALKILSLSVEILQGRDVFNEEIRDFPIIAIETNYLDHLLEYFKKNEIEYNLPQYYFKIANKLAEENKDINIAKDLCRRGYTILQKENIPGRGFSQDDILEIALFETYILGFEKSLLNMKRWTPQENIYISYTKFLKSVSNKYQDKIISIILNADLEKSQRVYSLLGILSNKEIEIDKQQYREITEEVLIYLENGTYDFTEVLEPLYDILEKLLSYNMVNLAKEIVKYCNVSKPTYYLDNNLTNYIKLKAFQTILDIEYFNPTKFEFENSNDKKYNPQLEQIRMFMEVQYPALICRLNTIYNKNTEKTINEIKTYLTKLNRSDYRMDNTLIYSGCWLIESIISLPKTNFEILEQIIDTISALINSNVNKGFVQYADLLSKDKRYYALAERLIYEKRKKIDPLSYSSREAVRTLFSLYLSARRFDQHFADNLYTDARLLANKWGDDNIDSLSFSILENAKHAKDDLNENNIFQLTSLFKYMKKSSNEVVDTYMKNLLHLLGFINPTIAFQYIKELINENRDLSYEDIVGSPILGLLDSGKSDCTVFLPLTQLISSKKEVIDIYRSSILKTSVDDQRKNIIKSFAKYLRTNIPLENRKEEINDFLYWADNNDMGKYKTIEEMKNLVSNLPDPIKKDNRKYVNDVDKKENKNSLLTSFKRELNISLDSAITVLKSASPKDIKNLDDENINEIIKILTKRLLSSQINKLLDIFEEWSVVWPEPKIFSFLIKILEEVQMPERVISIIKSRFQCLLTPTYLKKLSLNYYNNYLDEILGCKLINSDELIEIILSSIAKYIDELNADNIYRWIGHLGKLLKSQETLKVLNNMLARSLKNIPKEIKTLNEFFYDIKIDPICILIKIFSDDLGDPRQHTRWNALYILIDMSLIKGDIVLASLVNELHDKKHNRWITKREWLLFALHHISLRKPDFLEPYIDEISHHALSKEFPHAKIRYHAKEILINIEKNNPGVISFKELNKIKKVNEPKKLFTKDELEGWSIPYKGKNWSQKDDQFFNFDSMDTLPYWYSRLGRCFAQHRCHVADIAYKWIVNKWEITDKKCRKDREENDYDWQKTSNRQGTEPVIEDLKLYAERHAMFMAAGELIDNQPVFYDGDREGDRWHNWLRYRLRAADVSLPSQFIDIPPCTNENYGIFNKDFEIWVKRDNREEFKDELFEVNNDWIIVGGSKSGVFEDRQFGVTVKTALVNSKTSEALARSIISEDFFPLPYIDVTYDTILPELEYDLENSSDYYIFPDNEIDNGIFKLKSFLANWHQEMPFHSFDSKWPEHGRDYYFPSLDFCKKMHIYRLPNSLKWFNQKGDEVAYHKIWYDHYSSNKYTEGYKLVIKKDLLCQYLKIVSLDMIFKVTISRQKSSRYRKDSSEYDLGVSQAFILTDKGDLK